MTPQHLKHIRLELARSKEYPSGSTRHGYYLIAPLDKEGHIDPPPHQRSLPRWKEGVVAGGRRMSAANHLAAVPTA